MKSWRDVFAAYSDRRVLAILFLGLASGLPFPLAYSTLSVWLAEAGTTKTLIGLFSWAGTAYAFKFVWSPLVDRVPIPGLTRLLGQRRAWMLTAQLAVIAAILGLGSTDPAANLAQTALWTVILAVASATQDIVIDAYRIEILPEDLGAGSGATQAGYRIGMLAAGGGALVLADAAGWFWAYAAMAGLMGLAVVTVLLSPEPRRPERAPLPASSAPPVQAVTVWIAKAVISPLAEFMARPNWIVVLLFIAFYKYGDALLGVMANPFYVEIGFSKSEIGYVSKFYGTAMTIVGVAAGGMMVSRWGIVRALLVCGVLQAASNLVFALQAHIGPSLPMLMVTISVENLTGGMGSAAFVAYLSSLCNLAYTATQYALVSSFMAFSRTFFASGGGWLADHVDWVSYFLLTTAAAVPGLLLLLWMIRTFPEEKQPREASG